MENEIYFECSTVSKQKHIDFQELYDIQKKKIIEEILKIIKDKYKIVIRN
tara:strand:- start:419 stop:568 length:150 start_codon:yes stop_codon:yes gene_type:complete